MRGGRERAKGGQQSSARRAAEGVERQRENGTSKVASASSSNRQRERGESAGCAALKSGAVAAPITSTLNCNCLQSSSPLLPLLRCMRIE